MALMSVFTERPSSFYIRCGSCAEVCPQQIDIPGIMKDFAIKLGARS